jgi:sulfur-oxidizing protein SoxZ
MTPKPRIRIDKRTVPKGDVVEVQALVSHLMETGERKDDSGVLVPRRILRTFSCVADGQVIFTANLTPAIAANPFIRFKFKALHSARLLLTWIDDDGSKIVAEEQITVIN